MALVDKLNTLEFLRTISIDCVTGGAFSDGKWKMLLGGDFS